VDELGAHVPRKAPEVQERRRGVLLRRSCRLPRPPVYDNSEEEEDAAPTREPTFSAGDYVHDDQEEDAVIA
jgi:hypothetical protein